MEIREPTPQQPPKREIKFRAWDGWRMTYSGIMINGDNGKMFTAANMPLMQYTGLKDKNGKAIYEGDILSLRAIDFSTSAQDWRGIVEFGNPNGEYSWGWQLKPLYSANVNPEILLWVETELPNVQCEVIGNIYQNPEFLGDTKW